MDLDDTILQSKTTINLVLFIKELWEFTTNPKLKTKEDQIKRMRDLIKLEKGYDEIVKRTRKAAKKRSIKMKYQEI